MTDYDVCTRVAALFACLLSLLLCSRGATDDGTAVSVRLDHPRLLTTAEDLPRLQRQTVAYPEVWRRVQEAALAQPLDGGYGAARALTNAALAYLITGEDLYLANTLALAENICREHQLNRYASPEALFALALAYDWCYTDLTEAQRGEIQRTILHLADYLWDEIWRHSDFNNHFILEKVWAPVYAGLALHGDLDDPRVDLYLERGRNHLLNHALPGANAMAGSTGGQAEGYSYDSWGYMRPLSWILEAWRTATGEDLFPRCTATRYNALWHIYGARPFDGKPEHFDDAGLGNAWSQPNEGAYMYLLAQRYRDGHAQWLGDRIARTYDSYLWPIILWRDPELTSDPPDDLPTARLFDALGWVLMRSSWEPDATFASFQCGPFFAGHQHLDNNAFTLHKRALLAIDPGVNAYGESEPTNYRANYYSRTVAHNTILVLDPEEVFSGGPWAGEEISAVNDGGQFRMEAPERTSEWTEPNRWQIGKIVAYETDPLFIYAVGDATKSYRVEKVRLFRRHFLFLPPDLVVVFDQVEVTDPSFKKTWVLQTIDEPTVEGPVATVTNGPGRLTVRTVLPIAARSQTIGGPDKECWVAGRNWPPIEEEWTRDAGAWRLEISPPEPAVTDLFLHVLETDENEIAAPGAVVLVRDGDRVGVEVRAQGREYRVLFSESGVGAELQIEEAGHVVLAGKLS